MSKLDSLVGNVVDGYRRAFFIGAVAAVAVTIYNHNWIGFMLLGPFLAASYFGGLFILGQVLIRFVDKDLVHSEFISTGIRKINERLESGDLQPESEELEEEMKKVGLKPLSIITEKGPIFGRQFDADLYEWVDAKEGLKGSVCRYLYVGQAVFDEDGIVHIENDDTNKSHLILDGVLYEHIAEPKQD